MDTDSRISASCTRIAWHGELSYLTVDCLFSSHQLSPNFFFLFAYFSSLALFFSMDMSCKMYHREKLIHFSFQFWVLARDSGCPFHFEPYQGKSEVRDGTPLGKKFLTLGHSNTSHIDFLRSIIQLAVPKTTLSTSTRN